MQELSIKLIQFFTTGTPDEKGKIKFPTTLQKDHEEEVLKSSDPLQLIREVFVDIEVELLDRPKFKKAIIKSFSKLVHVLFETGSVPELIQNNLLAKMTSLTLESHRDKRSQFVDDLLQCLKDRKISILVLLLKFPFPRVELESFGDRFEDLLQNPNDWIDFSLIISHYSLSIDFERVIMLFLAKNRPDAVLLLVNDDESAKQRFLEILEEKAAEVVPSRLFFPSPVAKATRSVLKNWSEHTLEHRYENLYVALRGPEVKWSVSLLQDLEKNKIGHPLYPYEELRFATFSRTKQMVQDNTDLTDYASSLLIKKGFTYEAKLLESIKEGVKTSELGSEEELNRLIDNLPNSKSFYSPKAPIYLVSSNSDLEKVKRLVEGADLISLDCEWTFSTLSIMQLSLEEPSGKRHTLILNMLAEDVVQELFTFLPPYLNSKTWITFDHAQDLARISSRTGIQSLDFGGKVFDISKQTALLATKQSKRSLDIFAMDCLNVKLDKRPRMGNWDQRPLPNSMLIYAAGDSEILLDLYRVFRKRCK